MRSLFLIFFAAMVVAATLWWPRSGGAFCLPEGFVPGQRLPGAYPVARRGPVIEGWQFETGYRRGEVLQWNYRNGAERLTLLEAPDRVVLPPPSASRNGRRFATYCLGCDASTELARFVQ